LINNTKIGRLLGGLMAIKKGKKERKVFGFIY